MSVLKLIVHILFLVKSNCITRDLLHDDITTRVTWDDVVRFGDHAMFECETLSTVVVNVTHTWLLPNGTSTSQTFQDTTCGAGDCESFIDIPTVDFQHQGNYTCRTDFEEIIAFLEVESLCPHTRVSRATGLSFQLETSTESSAFDCMNRCENNTLCESITYISVTNECWLHNGTERSDDACHNDPLGYFYIKVCTTNTSCAMVEQIADSKGTGTVLETVNRFTLDECHQGCLDMTNCLGVDFNRNLNECRLYDSVSWKEELYWARQQHTQCDFYRKVINCYPVIECFPPNDLYGLYYRGKHSLSANGVCKNWRDTQFTHLKHHQNFCRRITTKKLGVYCVSAEDNTTQICPVSKCVNIQGSGVDVVFGDTGTIFINVTWHSEINITSFEWRKGGAVLNTSSPKYIVEDFPLPSLTVLNTTFDDEYVYEIDIHTEKYDTQTSAFFLDIVGHTPITRFMITPEPAVLGSPLDIECELLQPPSPNIVNYTLSRKRESDLVPELLTAMVSNETFDNTSVFIARFSTEHATILDYSEYTCKTINLISKKRSSRYLDLVSGESELSGFVYIPDLDKVLKPFTLDQKDKAEAEIHCQALNGTLLLITSLERQVYTEKLLREIWDQVSGNAFISGTYSHGGGWIINETAAVFTYWNSSFTKNEGSDGCITQQLDPPYRWTNVPCSEQLPYICELQPYCNEPNVTNATASPGSTYIFTSREFLCTHSKKSSTHLQCLEDLEWHGGCEPIICPTVSGVNASPLMNATYYFNDTLEFACDEGFKEDSGNTTLYCSIDETWIGDPLNCTEIVCPVNNVTNARLVTENVTSSFLPYMSTIEYECLPGFVLLSGVLINQCLENGNWTSLPTCTVPLCPLENINTTVLTVNNVDGYNTMDNMSLSCKAGYRHVSGDLNRTCLSTGAWSSPLPKCNQCRCPCDRVRPVQNLTDAELQAKIDQIKQELVLNTRTLSSSIRRRTSAKDERPSATGVGVVLGVGIVTFLVLAVIVPDIPMMIFSLRNNYVIQILIEKYRHRN